MKVLLFRPHCGTGGIMTWMLLHARELRRLGVECGFWFCQGTTRLPEFEQMGGLRVGPMSELLRVLARGDYDVVHVVNQDALAELVALVRPRPKIVVTCHGELSEAWSSRNCFAYTAVSHGMAVLNQPLTDLAVEVIPNGMDLERFSPPEKSLDGAPIVAWVGRSRDLEQKDFPRFTRVAAILAKHGVRFWVADASAAGWRDFADSPCSRTALERWQRVSTDDMPQFYRDVAASGGVLLMTSRYEGWGMVVMEAAASGLTTLGPKVVGLCESILQGLTGVLYRPEAPDQEIADLVMHWLAERRRSAQRTEECARAARQQFSAAAMTRRYLDVYERPEQRLRQEPVRPWAADDQDLAAVQVRFRRSRRDRAEILWHAAKDLVRAGQARLAWQILRRSIRLCPAQLARPARLATLASTAVALTRRGTRLVAGDGLEAGRQVTLNGSYVAQQQEGGCR